VSADISDETTSEQAAAPAAPHIQVLKGNPTDAEIAALVAVLGAAGDSGAEAGKRDRNLWGNPVDKLRIPVFSWQLITLRERTHMRR